jgi:hypothetical protein
MYSHIFYIVGLFAEYAVILANLIIQDKNHGPHLFYSQIQDRNEGTGKLSARKGVTLKTLPVKTALLGLDNACISFNQFEVPFTSLLNRFSSISKVDGAYHLHLPNGVSRMLDLLITRLLTGRISLSEYTIATALNITRHSWNYVSKRELWKGKQPVGKYMSELSLIKGYFVNYARTLHVIGHFIKETRSRVATCIKQDKFLPDVIEATCISKFVGTGFAVDVISGLRKLMGSQALFLESRLGNCSFVCNATCAAEGDNTIMELKIVQDIFRWVLHKLVMFINYITFIHFTSTLLFLLCF